MCSFYLQVDVDLGGNQNCIITGLVDIESRTIYALHGVVTIEHPVFGLIGREEAYMTLDYSRIVPS
jgi:hypothetical protein